MYNENNLLEISKLIALKSLKTIAQKGNINALEMLETYTTKDTIFNDIIQTVALSIIENDFSVSLVKYGEYSTCYKPKFDNIDDELTVYRTASNEFYKMKEKNSRHLYKEKYLDDMDGNGNYYIDIVLYNEAEHEREREESKIETKEMINQVYQLLTNKQRKVFISILNGYKQNEIAKNTGVTPQAVMKHRKAIIRKFASVMA